jgi:phage terminase large subunit
MEPKLKIKVSNVFERNYQTKSKIVVNQGSSRSGKTYSILQLLIFVKAYEETDNVFTICRKTLTALKATAMRDFFDILKSNEMYSESNHNKSENLYRLNGNLFEFVGLDQPQKKRGAKRDYLFINEANELTLEDWVQLSIRTTKQIYLDYNPSMEEHWIYEFVLPREDCTFIKSTYKDNEAFLDPEQVKEIENLIRIDINYWKIYGLGEMAQVRGSIYSNWQIVEQFPVDCTMVFYGLDFGYTNDPTAFVKIGMKEGELFLQELIYETNLTNQEIGERFFELGIKRTDEIFADSAEPKSIYEIYKMGFNIKPTIKGPDSILNGIDIVKRYRLNVTQNSTNLQRELKHYKWREDLNGKSMNIPIDKFNDLCDATRYGIIMKLNRKKRRIWVSKN